MGTEDWDDANDEEWCAQNRQVVLEYLACQPQEFGDVGDWPGWYLAPYVSVNALFPDYHCCWVHAPFYLYNWFMRRLN